MIRSRWSLPKLVTRVYRSKGGLWFPDYDETVPIGQNVLAFLGHANGECTLIPAANIVTTAGDIWYCQKAAGESPTNAFGEHECATACSEAGGNPVKASDRGDFTPGAAGSQKAHTGGYPKRNDTATDNTGGGVNVVSWAVAYTTGDFHQSTAEDGNPISHWIITNAAHGASEPILTGFKFATAFDKTASDTLKVYVNHTLLGA